MTDLLAARLQMAISLGFHIIFACIGMAMPLLMATSHWLWIKTQNPVYKDLTQRWSKGVAIFFAVGAVSGTALSFELGLLWPEFMRHAGPIIGMPFSWEGTAFFLEAIALGIFLYGWNRLPPWRHWAAGLAVGLCGVASAYFVICANAWMNSPAGFTWTGSEAVDVDPVAAMFNARSFDLALHMIIASFAAVGFAVAGVHALQLLKRPRSEFHKAAFSIAILIGSAAAILQPISGDFTAKNTAEHQPLKLAAMEAHFETEKGASLVLGGLPSEEDEEVNYAVKLPYLLSFLAHGNFTAEVKGLKEFDKDLWPPLTIVHVSFQLMVALGMLMAAMGVVVITLRLKGSSLLWHPRLLRLCVALLPAGFIAIEAGWVVTEVGRQPWVVYGVMKTRDALTPMPGITYTLTLYTILYLFLSVVVIWLLKRQVQSAPTHEPEL